VARADNDSVGRVQWHCLCDCGKVAIVRGDNLTSGRTTSCGCGKGPKAPEDRPAVIPQYRVTIYKGEDVWANHASHSYCFAHVRTALGEPVLTTTLVLRRRSYPKIHPGIVRAMTQMQQEGIIPEQRDLSINAWMRACGVVANEMGQVDDHEVKVQYWQITGRGVDPEIARAKRAAQHEVKYLPDPRTPEQIAADQALVEKLIKDWGLGGED